jgi:hypothetical protein
MHRSKVSIEDRVFELFGEVGIHPAAVTTALVREFGMTRDEAFDVAKRVLRERGTPRSVAFREAVEQIRF